MGLSIVGCPLSLGKGGRKNATVGMRMFSDHHLFQNVYAIECLAGAHDHG